MKVGTISEELRDQIIADNDIKEVAKEYGIEIGANNKARCPFHKDGQNGNLHFYEDSYHCYSRNCQAGTRWKDKEKQTPHILKLPDGMQIEDGGPGVIGFVMNIERCSYVEACVLLMNRAGIPIPEAKVDHKLERLKDKTHKQNIAFCKHLVKDKDMMEYLKGRGITAESVKKWRLGLVPDDHIHWAFKERVQGRLVFGLAEESWAQKPKSIAMAYRAMTKEQEKAAKYINDPNGDIYKKSEYLYGFNFARQHIRKSGYAIVMEGYVDVIISHQSGIENAVATCGTAFTDEQMDKLRRLTKTLIFWYDGDGPGYEAMLLTVPDLLAKGFRVLIVDSSPYDPAELMNKLGQNQKKIQKFIADNARPALQVLAERTLNEYDQKVNQMKVEALDELLPILGSITDESENIVFKSMISSRLGVVL